MSKIDAHSLTYKIKALAQELGFQDCRISNCDLDLSKPHYEQWLNKNYHGTMSYMQRNVDKRFRPELLVDNTIRIISVRMNYLPDEKITPKDILNQKEKAYISRYALGRDYHKIIRKRLQKLAQQIEKDIHSFGYRVFTDSAPILEKPIAQKAGIGWVGKHSNILTQKDGSWFFLGEIYTDLQLPSDANTTAHCGTCTSCMDVCPTQAIVDPYVVDANKCISYLTIEHDGFIDEQYHQAIGNRIYGCDDCQLFCPWNKFAKPTLEKDFNIRHSLGDITLLELINWSEKEFLNKMEGSPIRRIGYNRWLRNIAIALGNAPFSENIQTALKQKIPIEPEWLRRHIKLAIEQNKMNVSGVEKK